MSDTVTFSTYLGANDIEYTVQASVSEGEQEVRTLPNGDPGYPGSGPEVEIDTIELLGGFRPGSVYDYNQWLDWHGRSAMEELEETALRIAEDQVSPDDWDDKYDWDYEPSPREEEDT